MNPGTRSPDSPVKKIPFLMYHSVSPAGYRGFRPDGYWLTPEDFSGQLRLLKENGFSPVALKAVLGAREGLVELPDRPVVLTFDDGYLDNYLYARPRLREHGFQACFFLTASTLGGEGMMNAGQIRDLIGEGDEVGSHGLHHGLLAGKNRLQLLVELTGSKLALARELGVEIRFFSLPRGYQPPGLSRLARRAGYEAMCTSRPGYNTLRSNPFDWKRFPVRTGWGFDRFRAVVERRGAALRKVMLEEKVRSVLRWRHRLRV